MIGLGPLTERVVGAEVDRLLFPPGSVAHLITVGEHFGLGDVGHRVLMRDPGRVGREARHHLKDAPIVLEGAHFAHLEVAALFDPFGLVADRLAGLARPQEVEVHRVHRAHVGRARGGDIGLGGDESAVQPLAKPLPARPRSPRELVGRGLREIEAVDQTVHLVRHRA